MSKNKVALLLSGGPDSVTLLYDLLAQGHEVVALTYNFGEAEAQNERDAATAIAAELEVEHHFFDFSGPLKEFYHLPQPQFLRMAMMRSSEAGPVSKSEDVQPFGSAIALLLTASWAVKNDISSVFYAVHADDSHFTDNHREYFDKLSDVTRECEGQDFAVEFHTPYLDTRKFDVINKGITLGVPFGRTWSCAAGGSTHCGQCAPCINRSGAFAVIGEQDPVAYLHDPQEHLENRFAGSAQL
ncbi:7-cyano-7-deazaguanine synthase [Jonesia denitrificans]|uniref:7-cyano-7-deazaguanine synthase n=1 Tax=Jonesia denitrificans (strain ATCC 14870 / DSM 20603 / BCRC 15368 / CIP 55.134 / JCM 11481 / NBRC 15587 / NCTC 10816 / Prevot 55134) TaxID=471856 RepID=C7R591_JONDD|nr:7-cyano-7-deazaguanine synthase [Jonesia denitrificans]ACV07769.1 ExsB family protein [Jonesia denitrificans DSM 20603]ASE08511.1 7-cyano-7-deazaguanine synthase [Jonesia denitrificans]QXB43119.1 7-cyano-7-deazaguanine synthase [Jonesia denitrificans]SQH19741.1 queuosine biosynthesis protein QueC [Jonesia denitrificans]